MASPRKNQGGDATEQKPAASPAPAQPAEVPIMQPALRQPNKKGFKKWVGWIFVILGLIIILVSVDWKGVRENVVSDSRGSSHVSMSQIPQNLNNGPWSITLNPGDYTEIIKIRGIGVCTWSEQPYLLRLRLRNGMPWIHDKYTDSQGWIWFTPDNNYLDEIMKITPSVNAYYLELKVPNNFSYQATILVTPRM